MYPNNGSRNIYFLLKKLDKCVIILPYLKCQRRLDCGCNHIQLPISAEPHNRTNEIINDCQSKKFIPTKK